MPWQDRPVSAMVPHLRENDPLSQPLFLKSVGFSHCGTPHLREGDHGGGVAPKPLGPLLAIEGIANLQPQQ